MYYADLHIHSKYSRATSKNCNLEELALWASKKGLSTISTGDFTHPLWFGEIKEKLVEEEKGTYRLKPEIEKEIFKNREPVRFVLSVEISTIYKKGDKTRKVHHVVFCPDIEAAQKFRTKLDSIGNINSDGRPILGLDSRNLLEIALESGEGSYIIPAHIWTPWFSLLGSKSGFDSVEECYEDLAEYIFALETGLSSDPYMNWHVSKLDKYRLVSNSDAHSPSKLAREATVFSVKPDYFNILHALKTGEGYIGTVEFFPEEGKYHEDGHRKCGVCLTPLETKKLNGICPVCNKPLTIGVSYRVAELSDRDEIITPPKTAGKVFSLVPLVEILSEILQSGSSSKRVLLEYERLVERFGSELNILQNVPVYDISTSSTLLAEAIERLRKGNVIKKPGYDGEYGVIRLFEKEELLKRSFYNLKLDLNIEESKPKKQVFESNFEIEAENKEDKKEEKSKDIDEFQKSAIFDKTKQLLIKAGPGSGKTTVLTKRILHLIENKDFMPFECLAITFTKKAAHELKVRLEAILGDRANEINIHTFHSLCFSILQKNYDKIGLGKNFSVMSEKEKELFKNKDSFDEIISFDDLIKLVLELFEKNPEILNLYRDNFKYISVDEYQDIDENQYKLIRFLTGDSGNIFAIGDENQAIYGFRGGNSKFFKNFEQDYKNSKIINLKNNYRSTKNIVDASNQMIDSDNIVAKFNSKCEKITIHQSPTDKAEAEYTVSTIEKLIGGHSFFSIDSNRSEGEETGYTFKDFAILYRTKSQAPLLIEALERSSMPYIQYSNNLLCENREVMELINSLNEEDVYSQIQNLKTKFDIKDYIFNYLLDFSKEYNDKSEFIKQISLIKEVDLIDKRADRINIMTLHASKGLEFPCVFILGLEEGIIPFYRAQTQEEKEEEKRLLYVGMTRAKERLFLTRALKRKWLGAYRNLDASCYLKKIEEDLLNLTKFNQPKKQPPKSEQLTLFKL